jgi:hypothetical protein
MQYGNIYSSIQKEKSILYIQDIYLKLKERSLKKREWYSTNIINRIIDNIPTQNGEKVVLYYNKEQLYKTVFTKYNDYNSWGHSTSPFNMNNRTDKLFYLTDSLIDLRFELGELMFKYNNYNKNLHIYFWDKIERTILEKLNKQFKGKVCKKTFLLKVGEIEYLITCEDPYNVLYKRFKINEIDKYPIILDV